jgi:hypothetical protein
VTALELRWADDGGPLTGVPVVVDLALADGAEAFTTLPATLPAPPRAPTRLLVGASVVDRAGDPIAVSPFEVPVAVAGPTGSSGLGAAEATILAAGDIADCSLPGAALTARLVQALPGTVLTLGDYVYPSGTANAFATCYESTWGAVKGRTLPTPGNHEWEVDFGAPYFGYFGSAAGPGYYSVNLGSWHVLSLNSNVDAQPGSPQYAWARADLATQRAPCTLAYWHHPLFSSGTNGDQPQMRAMWQLLDEAGVDVVLAAHDHLYERFAPQDAHGTPRANGMRQFVVGTGGGALYGLVSPRPTSETRNNQGWGVLKMTLRSGGYDWDFVPAGGHTYRDAGNAACGL